MNEVYDGQIREITNCDDFMKRWNVKIGELFTVKYNDKKIIMEFNKILKQRDFTTTYFQSDDKTFMEGYIQNYSKPILLNTTIKEYGEYLKETRR